MKDNEKFLPQNWITVNIEEIAVTSSGGTPKRSESSYYGGNIPWVKSGELRDGKIKEISESITEDGLKNSSAKIFPKGTLCIAMYGATVGILTCDAATNQAVCALFLSEYIDTNYIFYLLKNIRKDLVAISKGGAQPNISQSIIKKTQIPLAPMNEQKRITNKIEALQKRSKKAKQALETAGPLLDKLRQSILTSAFRGDLTADWRKKNHDIEPASVLLERIRVERRKKWEENELAKMRAKGKEPKNDKWKAKYKGPASLDHSELYDLPSGWIWARFEDVAQIASNLVDPLKHLSYPHVAPDNIEKYTGRLLEYNTIEEDGVKSAKNKFFAGQIVYSKIRPYLSKCIIVNFDGLCSADMYPVDSYIDTMYLYRYILSNYFLFHIQKEAGNRVVLPKANQKQLNAVPVPVPPFSEQKQIAKKINKMFKKKEWLEKTVSQLMKKVQNLDQAVLNQAFQGELAPQDSSDEDASILLERMKIEQGNKKQKKKRKK